MEEYGDFHDWEVLQSTEASVVPSQDSDVKLTVFDEFGSQDVIRSDYFAVHSDDQYGNKVVQQLLPEGLLGSDELNPIAPSLVPKSEIKAENEFGPQKFDDSGVFGSDLSGLGLVSEEFGKRGGSGFGFDAKREVGVEGIRGTQGIEVDRFDFRQSPSGLGGEDSEFSIRERELDCESDERLDFDGFHAEKEMGFEAIENRRLSSDSGGEDSKFIGEKTGLDSGSDEGLDFDGSSAEREVGFEVIGETDKIEVEREGSQWFLSDLDGKDSNFIEENRGLGSGSDERLDFDGSNAERDVAFEGNGETKNTEVERECFQQFGSDLGSEGLNLSDGKRVLECGNDERLDFDGIGIVSKNSDEFLLDSVEFQGVINDESAANNASIGGENGSNSVELSSGPENFDIKEVKSGEAKKKSVVWYKLPLELFKFCVFRVSPVWSLSVAAAVVGFVILKKRLNKLKQKSRRIPLKVNIVDEKMSQTKVRVARLNEAFSVVKRVPIIRSSISGNGGMNPWPVVGLR